MEDLGQFRPDVNSQRWLDLSDLPNEVWLDIQGYEGVYQISCYGRIKSLPRTRRGGSFVYPTKIIKLYLGKAPKNNYYIVVLQKDGVKSTKRVCRLVAMAFIPNPHNLPQVNHKDENPSNNCADNLEWCDQKYNSNYGTNGQRISAKLTNGLRSKVVEQYDRKGNFIKEFPSVAEVSRLLGLTTSSVVRCCNGSKKYSIVGGCQWKYKGSDKQIQILPMINKYSQDDTLICSYNSVIEASEDTGVHHSSICQCFTGKKKSAGGFIWKKEL